MKSQINKIVAQNGKKAEVILTFNPFHISGGGQPGDSGTLHGDGFEAQVLDCRKSADGPVLELKLHRGIPVTGLEVEANVNLARHQVLSRMHSGEHVLSRIMESACPGLHVYKVAVGERTTSVFFHSSQPIDWDFLFKVEGDANSIVVQDRPVTVRMLTASEAHDLAGLKANWGRIQDKQIRIVEIQDFDRIACSGSHVERTGQIGEIYIESFKGGPEDWELAFSLDGLSSKSDHCQTMRRLLHRLHCRSDELVRMIDRLNLENKELSRTLSKIRGFVTLPREEITIADVPVFFYSLTGIPKDLAMPGLSACCGENPSGIVLALLDDGESPQIPFVLMIGKDLALDPRDLRKDPALAIRGGGSEEMLSGVTCCRSSGVWTAHLEEWIRSALKTVKAR